MIPKIIITRAQPGASDTHARLIAEGFSPVLSPALDVSAVPHELPTALPVATDLIFTSANGVRFFTQESPIRHLSAWCVGPSTTAAARAAGFDTVHNADGNANDLSQLIQTSQASDARHWLHIANTEAAGNLVESLQAAHLTATFVPLYATRPAANLTADARALLQSTASKIVLIHSAKGADAFLQLAAGADLSTATIVAISDNAARPFHGHATVAIVRAAAPNEDALMVAIHTAAQIL